MGFQGFSRISTLSLRTDASAFETQAASREAQDSGQRAEKTETLAGIRGISAEQQEAAH
jgi:hypothetical protein